MEGSVEGPQGSRVVVNQFIFLVPALRDSEHHALWGNPREVEDSICWGSQCTLQRLSLGLGEKVRIYRLVGKMAEIFSCLLFHLLLPFYTRF
jgi:hypothetical protein